MRRRRIGRAARRAIRQNPQRLDTLVGKILRIVPDLALHTETSTVSENGRYRIPRDNPFVGVDGRAPGDLGVRPPQPASAHVGCRSGERANNHLIAANIGLHTWETIYVVHKGANYGYSGAGGHQRLAGRQHDRAAAAAGRNSCPRQRHA